MQRERVYEIGSQYIIVVGLGGSGKTHAGEFLSKVWGKYSGRRVVITEEPSAGNRRAIFAAAKNSDVPAMAVVKMFYDDRKLIINDFVRPNLAAGNHVLSLRGFPCTFAYEGALGVPLGEIKREHVTRLGNTGADIVYYLRLSDPRIGLRRKAGELGGDIFDAKDIDYHKKVSDIYDLMAKDYGNFGGSRDNIFGWWITVDADQSVSEVQRQLRDATTEYLRLIAD